MVAFGWERLGIYGEDRRLREVRGLLQPGATLPNPDKGNAAIRDEHPGAGGGDLAHKAQPLRITGQRRRKDCIKMNSSKAATTIFGV